MHDSFEKNLPEHARQGIETVAALHARSQHAAGAHHLFIERATLEVGRPRTIYLILASVIAWVTYNAIARGQGWPCPDPPPYSWLQCAVGTAALVLTTMILTTQNRHARISESRSHLDLQVSLLAEQKVAKLIQLVEELRVDLPNVKNREDAVAKEMQEAMNPKIIAEAIEETLTHAEANSGRRESRPSG